MQRYFQISCHALILSAFLALAMTGRLELPVIAICAIGLGISCYRTVKHLPAILSTRGASLLSGAYICFFIFDATLLSRSFIGASIHLVLFLQLAKLYQEKTDRDYFYLLVLSFLEILAASSLTIDISFAGSLFLFLVALVSTLMSFDMYRSERKSTRPVEEIAGPLGGMSVWATFWIIVTGLFLFLIIPRIGTGYFTRAAAESLLVSGFTDSVQLGEIGQVKLSSAVVMHARQISGIPFAVLKWRGIALDHFDGRTWLKTNRKHTRLGPSVDGEYSIRRVAQRGDAARYEILLEPLATNTLFGPHQVRGLSIQTQEPEYDDEDSIYLRFPPAERVQYRVLSEIPDRARMLAAPLQDLRTPDDILIRYLQLPSDIDPRIAQLARDITAKGRTTFERASMIEGYLKRNYKYTLSLKWTPGPQPLSTFLLETKSGHCEYFASAMAILLRSVGIPTRLVNGFLMGEYNPVGHDYIVRQSDAHSWVEVYVPNSGWIEFDPTPPDPNQRELTLTMQLSHYVDAMELFWNTYILVYDVGAQMHLFHSAQDRLQSAQLALQDTSDRWIAVSHYFSGRLSMWVTRLLSTAVFWVASIVAVLGVTAFKYRHKLKTELRILRVRRGHGAAGEDVVELLFYRAACLVERAAQKRHASQTWREWTSELPDPRRKSVLARALIVFEKSKYGHMPVSPAEFALLEETIRDLKLEC